MPSNRGTGVGEYAVSFLVGLLAVFVGMALSLAIPETTPYHDLFSQATVLVAILVGLFVMLRLDTDAILRGLRNR